MTSSCPTTLTRVPRGPSARPSARYEIRETADRVGYAYHRADRHNLSSAICQAAAGSPPAVHRHIIGYSPSTG